MNIPKQTCWGCAYFQFTAFERGYSELTPGDDFDISCYLHKWAGLSPKELQEDFAAAMEIGFTCDVYEPRKVRE